MIHFYLKPVDDILAKYGKINFIILSDAFFYFKLNETEIFRYSDEILAYWKKIDPDTEQIRYALPYPDYTIQSLSNNLDYRIGAYLQPVPVELHPLINTQEHADHWLRQLDSYPSEDDLFMYDCSEWFYLYRSLGVPGIEDSPLLIWRINDTLHIRWKCSEEKDEHGIRVWQTGDGEIEIPVNIFMAACKSFQLDYLTELQQRIVYCQEKNIHIDSVSPEKLLESIEKEKKERIHNIETALNGTSGLELTDWDTVIKLNKPWIKK